MLEKIDEWMSVYVVKWIEVASVLPSCGISGLFLSSGFSLCRVSHAHVHVGFLQVLWFPSRIFMYMYMYMGVTECVSGVCSHITHRVFLG